MSEPDVIKSVRRSASTFVRLTTSRHFSRDCLALREVHLKAGGTWVNEEEGLCFVFAKAGAGDYASGSLSRRLECGDVLVVNAPAEGKLRLRARTEMEFGFFAVSLEQLLPLFSPDEFSLAQGLMNVFNSSRLYSGATERARIWHELIAKVPSDAGIEHRGQVLTVAASVLSEEFRNAQAGTAANGNAEERIGLVFEQVSLDDILDLSVEELAERLGCSRRHLSRVFQQRFGVSLRTLRMEMRLLKATSLLRDPESKIINVAGRCGFNHLGLFNTCFRRRFGVSPGQWRKNAGAIKAPAHGLNVNGTKCRLRRKGLCPWV